tara:strand:- start:3061 stop:3402 length:342 start_codon:yes stop_codon:yes gene_type:complete
MGFFDMIANAGAGVADMVQEIPSQIAEMPSNAMSQFGSNVDFIKALTQDPEEFEKFMMENPDFLSGGAQGGRAQVGIPQLPQMNFPMQQSPGLKINQMPNFLNSAQQVLSGGY